MTLKKVYIILSLLFISIINLQCKKIKLGIFDTSHYEEYRLAQFIEITNASNFEVEYKSIAQILDADQMDYSKDYDGILFILDIIQSS